MEIYKSERKAFVVISRKGTKKDDAVRIANKYFKTSLEGLEVRTGYVEGDALYLGGKADMWVVSRK